jgi:hypothetical protein
VDWRTPLTQFFHNALLPALALLATGAAKGLLSQIQNRSHERRSEALTKRINELEHNIAKLPKRDASSMKITPEKILTDELEQTIAELRYLQTREHYSFHQFCSDISFRARRMFLLYRPSGFAGYLLHTAFYGWLAMVLLIATFLALPTAGDQNQNRAPVAGSQGSAASDNPPSVSTYAEKDLSRAGHAVVEILALMLMFSVLSIPAWILRHFALKRLDKGARSSPKLEQMGENEMAAAPGASGI